MTEAKPDTRIAGLEKTLTEMQDKNRLGIHMWEVDYEMLSPKSSIETMDLYDVDRAFTKRERGRFRLTSLSMLPSRESGAAIAPYDSQPHEFPQCGYLLDMSQQREDRATVYAVDREFLNSGMGDLGKLDKGYDNKGWTDAPRIPPYYKQRYVEAPSRATAEAWLDRLGKHYADYSSGKYGDAYPAGSKVYPYNEVIAEVGLQHRLAIVLPCFAEVPGNKDVNMYRKFGELLAPLAWLEHYERGDPLPLVRYHVDGPKQGQCELIAQSREQALGCALSAVRVLRQHTGWQKQIDEDLNLRRICEHCREKLGIDLRLPLSEQREAVKALEAQIRNEAARDRG